MIGAASLPPSATQAGGGVRSPAAYAVAYSKLLPGFVPFPLIANQKEPAKRGWQAMPLEEATAHFHLTPRSNLGLALPPGTFALDIDVKGQENGFETLQAMEATHGELPVTLTQRTPSGGEHRIYHLPAGVVARNSVRIMKGCDIRAKGGYIVAEPSSIDGAAYAWMDFDVEAGEVPDIALAPDWLVELVAAPPSKTVHSTAAEAVMLEGQRNDSLFKKACTLRGHGFEVNEIEAALQSMNRRMCSPPLPDTEVTKIAASSGRYQPNQDPAHSRLPVVYHDDEPQPSHAMSNPARVQVPKHLLSIPGKLNQMVQWANATASKPQPYFAVQAALALGSVAMGRKFRSNLNNFTNLYFLNIAPSGAGKEHAKTAVEECLEAAGLHELVGGSEYSSDSAIDSQLLDKPTHISFIDEFGYVLEAGNAKNNHIGGTARKRLMEVFGRAHSTLHPKAYSTAGLTKQQRDARGNRAVKKPSVSVVGMTTPGTFFDAVGSGSLKDGFLNRFITVISDLGRQPSQNHEQTAPPAELVQWVKACRVNGGGDLTTSQIDAPHDVEPQIVEIPFEAAALALLDVLDRDCIRRMDELEFEGMSEMYTRVREITMKVALIVAHSCESKTIKAEHVQWATDYVRFWADNAIKTLAENVADSPFGSLCNTVANQIHLAGPKGLTEAEIGRRAAKFKAADPRMRSAVFTNLASDRGIQKVESRSLSGKGKTRIAYIAPEYSQQ